MHRSRKPEISEVYANWARYVVEFLLRAEKVNPLGDDPPLLEAFPCGKQVCARPRLPECGAPGRTTGLVPSPALAVPSSGRTLPETL